MEYQIGPIVLLRGGFAQAVLGVLRTKADGLISLGPPCGSFVFINLATSQRSEDCPYGDENKRYVELASLKLSRIAQQSCLALANLVKNDMLQVGGIDLFLGNLFFGYSNYCHAR